MKLCSRLLMVFGHNFCYIRQIWVSEPHSGEVRSDAWPWLMARWKAHGQLSLRVNWTFLLSITVTELWGKMCTARLVDLFALEFYLDNHSPTILGIRKLEILRWWRPHPSALPHFDTIRECDEQMDGWICCSIDSACKVSFAECCKNCDHKTAI